MKLKFGKNSLANLMFELLQLLKGVTLYCKYQSHAKGLLKMNVNTCLLSASGSFVPSFCDILEFNEFQEVAQQECERSSR